jgi:leucyl aminopeptidase
LLEREFVLTLVVTLLKPAKFMEDMTYDMAGSATVVGLMKNLAIRKAKINAVGVVGTC